MSADDLLRISRYVMPAVPAQPSRLGFLFGTRHGVEDFCARVLAKFGKIPGYLEQGFLRELDGHAPYPVLGPRG